LLLLWRLWPGYELAALSLADTERLPGVEHGRTGTMRST
jgi:hypothetical protein